MGLKKGFIHAHNHLPTVPLGRLITGLLVGLFFALFFYSFLYVCREGIRVIFFMTDEYDILVLSDTQVNIFNLILAYISTIMGQSLCFTYWFDGPLIKYGKHASTMRAIINDQRSLNSYFISWFSRLAYLFPLLMGIAMGGGIYVTASFSGYYYVFILIILVLFLHTWNNLRRLFNGKSFKAILASAVIISVISFGFSRINLVDYQAINKMILSKNIYHTHKLQLPESGYYDRINSPYARRSTIYITEEKTNTTADPVLFITHAGDRYSYRQQQISIDSLKACFIRYDERLLEEEMHNPCVLYIHRDIKMKHINTVKKILAEQEAYRIQYAVIPLVRDYDERYYTHLAFPWATGRYYADENAWKELQNDKTAMKPIFELRTTATGEILFDDIRITRPAFQDLFKDRMETSHGYCIEYYINDDSTYADYIFIISNIIQAIGRIRDEYSIHTYQLSYDALDWEVAAEVRKLFPYRIIEFIQ